VIGGSFLQYGGHNPLEPAALEKAIVFGPHMANFREIAALLLREQAARQCSIESLPEVLIELLDNRDARAGLGNNAAAVFARNRGATENTLDLIVPRILHDTESGIHVPA
jgi:3-deoxy-D-manno-octulosonic-acid transferase